jgi:hypothetical protein
MFANLMLKKRKDEARLKNQGVEDDGLETDSHGKEEGAQLPPPNGFGGSPGDYMRSRLNQIPAEKVEKMLGRYPAVIAEMGEYE